MAYKIEEIEGIGAVLGEKLRTANVITTDDLLTQAQTPAKRKALAEATGISEAQLLKFTNKADLFRLTGVSTQFSDLLEASGVDTVPELAQRNATNLAVKMAEVNEAKNLCNRAPSEAEVTKWIEQAKTLPRAIEY